MRWVAVAVVLTICGASPLPVAVGVSAERIVLWQSTTVGMTVPEVRSLVPEAVANQKPEPNKDGWMDLLVARKRSAQHDQDVSFQFKDGRLVGVIVNEGLPFGLSPIGAKDAKAILENLKETYGAPTRCQDTDDGFHACFWLNGGKFIGYLERPPPTTAVMQFLHAEQPSDRDLLK